MLPALVTLEISAVFGGGHVVKDGHCVTLPISTPRFFSSSAHTALTSGEQCAIASARSANIHAHRKICTDSRDYRGYVVAVGRGQRRIPGRCREGHYLTSSFHACLLSIPCYFILSIYRLLCQVVASRSSSSNGSWQCGHEGIIVFSPRPILHSNSFNTRRRGW